MNTRLNLRSLLPFAGAAKFLALFACLLAGTASLAAIASFWFVREISSCVFFDAPRENLSLWTQLAALSAGVSVLAYILAMLCSHKAAFRASASLRLYILNHAAVIPISKLQDFGTGHLRRIIVEAGKSAEEYIARHLPDKFASLFALAGTAGLLIYEDWRLALAEFLPAYIAFTLMASITSNSMASKISEYQTALNSMSSESVEYVRGLPVSKAFGHSAKSLEQFQKAVDGYEAWTSAYTLELRTLASFFALAVNSCIAFVVIVGAVIAWRHGITNEFIKTFILAVMIPPVISDAMMRTIRRRESEILCGEALEHVSKVLQISRKPQPESSRSPEDSSIEISNVSFKYGWRRLTDAVSNVNLSVKPGQVIALAGHSGSGKSTIVKLIAHFFDVSSGNIMIGRVNISDISTAELMRNIAFVFQDSRLIKGTILENVKMSRPDASDEEVRHALELAQCGDIIAKYPPESTIIGGEGVHLSVGEAQRICVARAILKDAPILVLDEPTAYADPEHEAEILEGVVKFARSEGKTVILIAHRLSAVRYADVIAVLRDGKLAESGSFNELLARRGVFLKMWSKFQETLYWKLQRESN